MQIMERCCTIRASVDTLEEAKRALLEGAAGIGLFRTEAMLLAPSRLPALRKYLIATDANEREKAVSNLLSLHEQDFAALFQLVSPLPVTIRLIDPPLQELFPTAQQLSSDLASAQSDENWDEYVTLERVRQYSSSLSQENPSMGHRGCRLSLTNPEILCLQVQAILRAAVKLSRNGVSVSPEIMIPLVASEQELRSVVAIIRQTASDVFALLQAEAHYKIGALIELPRAALCAGSIAEHVDFVSFGTNDLTQMTYGLSKADARRYMKSYLEQGIFERDPFVSLDREGVGRLIEDAIREIRQLGLNPLIGICGDHASDPESLHFFQSLAVDYVSCAPESIGRAKQIISAAVEVILPEESNPHLGSWHKTADQILDSVAGHYVNSGH